MKAAFFMKKIQLTQGYETLVDDKDYPGLCKFKWYFSQGYAKRDTYKNGKRYNFLLHRLILKPPHLLFVDHINHNGLDNQRSNLRIVTHTQNMRNCKVFKTSKTKFSGITFFKPLNKWRARITVMGKEIFLGYFTNIDEAIQKRKKAESIYWNESLGNASTASG